MHHDSDMDIKKNDEPIPTKKKKKKSKNILIRITKNPNIFYTIDFWTAK